MAPYRVAPEKHRDPLHPGENESITHELPGPAIS
jgi:hypothetical protein